MATLTKDSNTKKVVLGWYGECDGEECAELNLSTLKDNLFAVWQLSSDGTWKGWSFSSPSFVTQPIMKFECGKLYFVVLKSGEGSFTIPNFVVSTYDSGDLGRITSSCVSTPVVESTPTPTPKQTPTPTPKQTPTPTPKQETSTQECCPSSRTKINAAGMPTGDQFADTVKITHDLGDKTVVLAELLTSNDQVGGVFCVDLTLTPNWTDNDTELASLIYLEDTSGSPIGTFKKQLLNNLNEVSYQDPQNNCYVGTYEGAGENLVLTKTDALISEGDSTPEQTPTPTPKQTPTPTPKQTPTPTPKQTPTPTPTPTPVPALNQLQFRWKTTTVTGYGEREVLQVKNILKPTNSTFGNRDTENSWSTLYAFTANPGSYSLNDQSWPDAAVSVAYDSEHGNEVKIDALTIGFGSVEGSGDGAYKQLTASHEANEKTIEFSTDSDYTIPAPLFIYIGDGNNETAVGVNSFWPVIMKALESTPTPKENTPTPKPECTCAPEGLETVVAQTSAIFMHDGFHSFGTFQPGTVISYDKSTFKTEGITSQVMFKFPDGSNAGIMMFGNSQKPDNTKFYFKVGNKCYSATAQSSQVSIWQLTLSLDSTLPDACIEDTDEDEDSFADSDSDSGSIDCCDNNLILPVIAGESKVPETNEVAYYGIQVRTIDTGEMDGQLCWEEPNGELQFEMMKAFLVEFQDFSTNENQQLLIETTTPTSNVVFKYKLRSGECYEGVLSETLESGNVNTFNLV